ncbi:MULTISPECIES: inclusion body family protein [Flavobacterium]|uniref:Inclusion body family protein n=1 Tax=Flavobacterium jumunjinense TaxID=998845 RepID=A0ABV5GU08_9FLAO|nr:MULTISPECIES: inclusion body family protein [Flavobacterium]
MTPSISIIQKTTFKILIVIDTIEIKQKYPNPNNNLDEPIKIGQGNWYTIYPYRDNIEQTNSLHFVSLKVQKKDKIVISGISIDGGSSDAIILNEIQNYNSRNETFSPFESICVSKKMILNNPNSDEELSIISSDQNFIWFESVISNFGKSKIDIIFSIYNLDDDGNQQSLYGCFCFPLHFKIYE